jgi:hypothetical protein
MSLLSAMGMTAPSSALRLPSLHKISTPTGLVMPWLLLHLLYQRRVGRDLQSHVHDVHRCWTIDFNTILTSV